MQTKELSNKIENEPEKNNIQKVIENPKGSILVINIHEIQVSENIREKWASLSYSLENENCPDDFFSSSNSKLNSKSNHMFNSK